MKKFLLVLGMVACLFGMTACSEEATTVTEDTNYMSADDAAYFADLLIVDLNDIISSGAKEQYASQTDIYSGITSWESAIEEMGSYIGITTAEGVYGDGSVTITAEVDGEKKDADMTMILDASTGNVLSVAFDVQKTFGELMTNAALNTLLGMGTVFIVLILIAWLISLFKYIGVAQEKLSGKKKEEAPKAAPAPVVAAPAVEEAAEEDDLELIAVIAAAIAASEGAASADGFVVRSVKRRGNKWQKA